MALVEYKQEPIRVPIQDAVIGGTVVKRKALLKQMTQTLPDDSINIPLFAGSGGTSVTLSVFIEHYAVGEPDAEGKATYGERLNKKFPGIDYPTQIVANSQTLVDATTGAPLCKTSEYENAKRVAEQNPDLGVDLPAALLNADGSEKEFMKEDDFFRRLADLQPIIVTDLEETYIQTAALSNKI